MLLEIMIKLWPCWSASQSCCRTGPVTWTTTDEVRRHLFTKQGLSMESPLPTKAALVQHAKRAVYQAGHIWGQTFKATPALPSPVDWGWTDPPEWKPLWTTLREACVSSRELLCCGCKKGCRGRCKCNKAALPCTAICHCGGDCKT